MGGSGEEVGQGGGGEANLKTWEGLERDGRGWGWEEMGQWGVDGEEGRCEEMRGGGRRWE